MSGYESTDRTGDAKVRKTALKISPASRPLCGREALCNNALSGHTKGCVAADEAKVTEGGEFDERGSGGSPGDVGQDGHFERVGEKSRTLEG